MIRWDLVTVGHLSRNRYWGESEDRPYRDTCCTCTLIRAGERAVLVDPGLPPEQMAAALDRRTGQRIDSVDAVFVTHRHGDHWLGIEAFPGAEWLMAPGELEAWRAGADGEQRRIADRFAAATGPLAPGVELLATPGHTEGLTSLAFRSEDRRVVVAGDGVMTADFFRDRGVYFNSVDPGEAVRSIDRIAEQADVVVPGHDNVILVPARQDP